MGHPVLQGVRPGGRLGGHGGVVIESVPEGYCHKIFLTTHRGASPAEHVEHSVSSHSQERSSHALDVGGVDPSEPDQLLSLSHHLICPGLLVEVGTEGVGHGVGSHLVSVSVEVLDLGVVSPLVGHVESGLNGAAVGVVATSKELLIERLVEIVDGIIEGEEDELRYLVWGVAAGNVPSSAVAVLQTSNKEMT